MAMPAWERTTLCDLSFGSLTTGTMASNVSRFKCIWNSFVLIFLSHSSHLDSQATTELGFIITRKPTFPASCIWSLTSSLFVSEIFLKLASNASPFLQCLSSFFCLDYLKGFLFGLEKVLKFSVDTHTNFKGILKMRIDLHATIPTYKKDVPSGAIVA